MGDASAPTPENAPATAPLLLPAASSPPDPTSAATKARGDSWPSASCRLVERSPPACAVEGPAALLGDAVLPRLLILPRPPVLSLLPLDEGRGEISEMRVAQRAASLFARLWRPQRRLPAAAALLLVLPWLEPSPAGLGCTGVTRVADTAGCCWGIGSGPDPAAAGCCCVAWMALRSATRDLCSTAAAMVASRGGPHCVLESSCSSVSRNLQHTTAGPPLTARPHGGISDAQGRNKSSLLAAFTSTHLCLACKRVERYRQLHHGAAASKAPCGYIPSQAPT